VIDAGERAAMEQSLRAAIADALARTDATVDDALTQVGWLALLREQPDDAIAIVFGALGATGATATALDDVLATALGHEPRADVAVVLPRFATWDPPARLAGAGVVDAHGLATARTATASQVLVVCGVADEPALAVVPASAITTELVRGIDPDARLRTIHVQGRASRVARVDAGVWRVAVALGQRALAHQIAGACRTMLDLARTHALTRAQFGRPVARFQAVRHRLAESLVAIEGLDAALGAARDQPDPATAALAKAIAGRAAQTVSRHCQQVLAGVGFTTEHAFHRFAKRVLLLDGLLGSADRIVLDVGRRLVAERRVPTLIEL
jgi:hypothetical protein